MSAMVVTKVAAAAGPACGANWNRPACTGPRTPREYLSQKLDPSNFPPYDKSERPVCADRGPTIVEVQLGLTQINSIDQKQGILSVSGYLRMWWKDPRLAYNATCAQNIDLTGDDAEEIWTPDLYIDNLVKKTTDGFPSSVSIDPIGNVRSVAQVKLEVKNSLDLGKLPYDEHTLKIVVASYSQDIGNIRIMAKGGTTGAAASGVGVDASPMVNTVWELPEGAEDDGFETAGEVSIVSDQDFLSLTLPIKRKPKFLIDQVIVPAILFLLVSYIQFWVDPAAAPARAALAVIPVLIMRTLSNSVYRSLPEGSQQMWLVDNLSVLTFLCILAAVEFGAVEFCVLSEKAKGAKHAGLKASAEKAQKIIKQAATEKVPVADLLKRYQAVPVEKAAGESDAVAVDVKDGDGKKFIRAKAAVDAGIRESDLLFVQYTKQIFDHFDKNESNEVNAKEVRAAFTFFNIYLAESHTPRIMCMFLRDQGEPTPQDESKVELTFAQFCGLLLSVEKYKMSNTKRGFKGYIQAIPPSKRWDVAARSVFPILIIGQQVIMQLVVGMY